MNQPPGPPVPPSPPPGPPSVPPPFGGPPGPARKKGIRPWQVVALVVGGLVLLCCGGGLVSLVIAGNTTDSAQPEKARPTSQPPSITATTQPAPTTAPPPPTAAPATQTRTYSGRGAKTLRITKKADEAMLATITHRGSANFAVTRLDAQGQQIDLLVNTIGNYTGTRLVDPLEDENTAALKIEADGAWTVTTKPTAGARRWNGAGTFTGRGDDVINIEGAFSGLDSLRATHQGQANFAVTAYGESMELLVNEIGNYSGEHLVPNGAILLSVDADGRWTMQKV